MANDVQIKVGADTTQLTTGLKTATAQVEAFATKASLASRATQSLKTGLTSMQVVGAGLSGMAGGFAAMGIAKTIQQVKELFDEAGRINDLSQRFGVSAESIQRVKIVADASGTSLETIAKSMHKGELAAVGAARGNEKLQQAFVDVGISAEEFAGMSVEERVVALADAYNNGANKGKVLAGMNAILGKSAGELVPMFAQGGDAIKKMMSEATVASSDAIAKMDELSDRIGEMWQNAKYQGMSAIAAIMDGFQKVGLSLTAANAWWGKLLSGEGLDAANAARDEVVNSAVEGLDAQTKARQERNNRMSKSDVTELYDAEAQAATDQFLDGYIDDMIKSYEDESKKLQKVAEDEYDKLQKVAKDAAVDGAKQNEDIAGDRYDRAKNAENNLVASDDLRRIGGGFAKSNYGGLSREAMLISKQVDMASKQLSELKKIVSELQKSDPLGGITT
jgi:hypothetical protein